MTISSSSFRLRAALGAPTRELERELDVAARREPREQRRLLEHEAGAAPLDVDRALRSDGRDPPTRLSSVLLPQPDAPRRQTNSPGPTASDTLSSAWTASPDVAEHLRDAVEDDRRRGESTSAGGYAEVDSVRSGPVAPRRHVFAAGD